MFVVLDVETTWLSSVDDRIIEIALIKISPKDFREVDRISTFVNPEIPIPKMISQITTIFDTDVEEAPVFEDIREQIQEFIEDFPLIGHNIPFDIRFLESHGIVTTKNAKIDTFFLANFLCFEYKSLNLWFLSQEFWIELENAHRAIDDTIATIQVFQTLIQKLQSVAKKYPEMLWHVLSLWNERGIHIIRDTYLDEPKKLFSWENCIEEYIKNLKKNTFDTCDKLYCEEGKNITDFLEHISGFELRESQKKMLDIVDTTLVEWKKTVIEAPTGIGKTFAYLLPAIQLSLKLWEPVHISTSTKALQDQIFYKDLSFLHEQIQEKFSYTKLKGKRNYLGIAPFLEFLEQQESYSPSYISFVLKILLWSMESEFGELDELDFFWEEFMFVSQIHAGDGFIFDTANPYKHVEFVLRARTRAKNANIIITNNHILFQDSIADNSLLWGVKNLIVDEAHALEDVVTQSLKKTLSFQYIETLVTGIEKKLKKYKILTQDFWFHKQRLIFGASEIFSLLEGSLFEMYSFDTKYKNILLDERYIAKHEDLVTGTKNFCDTLTQFYALFQELDEKILKYFLRELQDILYIKTVVTDTFLQPDFLQHIYYISHDEKRGTQLHMTLLKPWVFLEKNLWNTLDSVVLTSATLQMDDEFAYIKKMLHLEAFDTFTLSSDFDYSKQALVYIPQDLGSIKNNLTEVVDFLQDFFIAVGGKTLVLCTAFASIQAIFTNLKHTLATHSIHLLAQSVSGSKQKQMDFFMHHPENSILVGTDTFWEGIDIPWEDLQYLVVHKIPFSVPSDPIFQARGKLFKNSFEDYAIPKSILKLKQGFWRLIRSKKDTGIIVFLDDRISTTTWWERFFTAFPPNIKIRFGEAKKLIDILSENN